MALTGSGEFDVTFMAATTVLQDRQFFAVYSTGAATNALGYVTLAVSATQGANRAIGILQNEPSNGGAAQVRMIGLSKWATEAAVAYGALLACSTAGTAYTVTSSLEHIMGMALSASVSTSGEIITALLLPAGNINA